MCLSTVYNQKVTDKDVIMKNVAKIEEKNGKITLTDLMERKLSFSGNIISCNLLDNFIVVDKKD